MISMAIWHRPHTPVLLVGSRLLLMVYVFATLDGICICNFTQNRCEIIKGFALASDTVYCWGTATSLAGHLECITPFSVSENFVRGSLWWSSSSLSNCCDVGWVSESGIYLGGCKQMRGAVLLVYPLKKKPVLPISWGYSQH